MLNPAAHELRSPLTALSLQAEAGKTDLGVTSREDIVVRVPPHAVEAVLKNLVDNAIRYTPEGGRVDLHAGYEQGGPVMIVSDTGPGIPEEERGRVFDPFYRCMGNAVSGSGLGLSIVYNLVQLMGGSSEVEREREKGSVFTVILPFKLAEDDQEVESVQAEKDAPEEPAKPSVHTVADLAEIPEAGPSVLEADSGDDGRNEI